MARKGTKVRAGGDGRSGFGSLNWVLVVVAVALVATVVAAVKHRTAVRQAAQAPAVAPPVGPTPVSAEIMNDFRSIPAATWNQAVTGDAAVPTFVGDADASAGKPILLYIGAGYCPYCAAARWSMIAALSRFGTFSGLTLSASSSVDVFPSTPTFSFFGSHYVSQYIELQTVELATESLMADGRYEPLETPTQEQDALIRKYDAPPYLDQAAAGGIPFILVGGRYMWSGSPFSPAVLAHQTQADIAATLPTGSGPAAQAILANANELAAAICAVDGDQPADVCSAPAVRKAIEALPHKTP